MHRLPAVAITLVMGASSLTLAQSTPSGSVATVRFTPDMLDKSIDPCTDFYAYACSKWQAQNPIPSDRPSWGRFNELQDRGEVLVRGILEKYSKDDPKRSAIEQKIGDYYHSCMDESAIEKAGAKPLQPTLDRVAALKSKDEFAKETIALHRDGVHAFFDFGSQPDFKDAQQVISAAEQGGLGLPDRDYYFKDDEKSVEIRKQYLAHVQKMFELLGDPSDKAAAEAKVVMDIETALAKGSLDRTSQREPEKIYHKMPTKELAELNPSFAWNQYFDGIGAPPIQSLNVAEPEFFKQFEATLKSTSLEDWKTYLRWHVLHSNAAMLPAAFVNENFAFFAKTLQGTKELAPRWKRCVRAATGDLGEAIGQIYVADTFGAEGKERTLKMVNEIEKALGHDIETLPWMGEDTKKQALVKLKAITNRIGYPDKWKDYSTLRIVRGDALGNSLRSNTVAFQRDLNKVGKPVDKGDWPYPPMTVNASYNPLLNNITFPAGILQPPFFDNQADDALNYGAIGAAIGHELTHGFDDEGAKFDPVGNLKDWWTAKDKEEFEKRTSCVQDQYAGYSPLPDVKLNGKLTLGENTADNGGLRIAYMALLDSFAGKQPAPVDGFTAQQRFFLGFANVWCQNRTDQITRYLANIDPHSPGKFRVNGTVSNMPEFREAFHCKADTPMVRENACRVW
jgi:endothelin-converting enzyme/putative endopeptidase